MMTDEIHDWLIQMVGFVLQGNQIPAHLLVILIPKILHNHGIINSKDLNMLMENDWRTGHMDYVRILLNNIGVKITNHELEEFLSANCDAHGCTLIYEIYTALKCSSIHKLVATNLQEIQNRFKVVPVIEHGSTDRDIQSTLPTFTTFNYYSWYREKMNVLKQQCVALREQYLSTLNNRRMLTQPVVSKVRNVESLYPKIDLFMDVPVAKKCKVKTIRSIKLKVIEDKSSDTMYRQMCRWTSQQIFDAISEKQDTFFEEQFEKKLAKKSGCESQLQGFVENVMCEKDYVIDRKALVDEQVQRMMLNTLEEICADFRPKDNHELELERNAELHSKLEDVKSNILSVKITNMCADIVTSIVDTAIFIAEYHEVYNEELPPRTAHNLACFFIKEQSPFKCIEDIFDLIDYEMGDLSAISCSDEEKYAREQVRQACLNVCHFEDYNELKFNWSGCDPEDPGAIECGRQVLGFAVHRLLLIKYPRRVEVTAPIIPQVKIAMCVEGFEDLTYVPELTRLLSARNVTVLMMLEVINHCLSAFKAECSPAVRNSMLLDDDESSVNPLDLWRRKSRKFSKINEDGVDAECQTPELWHAPRLSHAANLGMMAHEALHLGGSPNDYLMTAMLLEYLKGLKGIEGWVLINYPQTTKQMSLMEQALTGVSWHKIPSGDGKDYLHYLISVLYRNTEVHPDFSDDVNPKRYSRLLPTTKENQVPLHKTYLTGFVSLRSSDRDEVDRAYYNTFKSKQDIIDIHNYYSEHLIMYTLDYNVFDSSVAKQLAKFILGDQTEIFHEKVNLSSEIDERSGEFEEVEIVKVYPRKKASKSTSKVFVTQDIEALSKSKFDLGCKSLFSVSFGSNVSRIDYASLPISKGLAVVLATIWEATEEQYISIWKSFCFRRRLVANSNIKHRYFARKNSKNIAMRWDNRQAYLSEFQEEFNALEPDLREDVEVKEVQHGKVKDLKALLMNMSENKFAESENDRKYYVGDEWLCAMLSEIIHMYVACLKGEMDRCANTIQILMDYYMAMATGSLNPAKVLSTFNTLPLTPDETLINFTNQILVNLNIPDDLTCPFTTQLDSNVEACFETLAQYIDVSNKMLTQLKKLKDNGAALLEEAQKVIDAEYQRTKFRMKLIQAKGAEDILWICNCSILITQNCLDQIVAYYKNEVCCINKACAIFQAAIENETVVKPKLLFVKDRFYMVATSKEPQSVAMSSNTEMDMLGSPDTFTVQQLSDIADQLLQVTPSGVIFSSYFSTFLLALTETIEDDNTCLVPEMWMNLQAHKLESICRDLFGTTNYLNWKDFIINCSGVEFPTEDELLLMKKRFQQFDADDSEVVEVSDFMQVKLWYECDNSQRFMELKNLWIKLYKINDTQVNYTAFLLDFCKDELPILGFVKVITVMSGHLISWRCETGEPFYEIVMSQTRSSAMTQEMSARDICDTSVSSFQTMTVCADQVIGYLKGLEDDEPCEIGGPICEFQRDDFTHLQQFVDLQTVLQAFALTLPWLMTGDEFKSDVSAIYDSLDEGVFDKVFSYTLFNAPSFVAIVEECRRFTAFNVEGIVKANR